MFWRPANAVSSFLIALLFIENHIKSYCQVSFNTFPYSFSGMAPLPASPMSYAHAQPVYHLPQDKTEIIVVGDKGGKQEHHHHHHHHHKNIHHHHHGHKHSHGHNHNHDHKHDHGHKHDHNHNHNHNHGHKHAHGHKHQHNHDHGHQHKHGHLHDHKHAHILLHRQFRQLHGPNNGPIHQQGYNNNNYGSYNVQHHIDSNSYEQHNSNHQENGHQQDQQHNIQQQNHYVSHHSNSFPPNKQQQYNKYISNNHQHSNYDANNPDHVAPSYLSTGNNEGISHNEDHENVQQGHNFKVHYDESKKDDAQQTHYEHSASTENASYEPKEEYNHNAQDANSHSSEYPSDLSGTKSGEIVSSAETGSTSPRFTRNNINTKSHEPQHIQTSALHKSYNTRLQNSNIPNDPNKAHRLKEQEQNSDDLSVAPQVNYGVRLGQNGYNDYQKKEASMSSVTFLQGNGEIKTVGNDDPFVSVGRPMKLEDAMPEESYRGESLESKLSSGRMTLTAAQDYKATIGKIDEVFNIPIFD